MPDSSGDRFTRLVDIMRTLRSPDGCPWDREQTLKTLAPFVLEETYEVLDAIERGDLHALEEEVGDLLFEGVFLAQVAADAGAFTVADSLQHVAEKLVRRHPHVFKDTGEVHDAESKARAPSARAALDRWDALKAQERAAAGRTHRTLGGVPASLPALLRAYKLGKRAASVGFDWPQPSGVLAKIQEEVAELGDVARRQPADPARVEDEVGDLLFAIANLCRHLDVEPEAALRRANDKFTRRFTAVEQRLADAGRRLDEATLEEMEEEWGKAKDEEHRHE